MSMRETNIALLSRIPEDQQRQIYDYLINNFCKNNPYVPKSASDLYCDLAESRASYECGECEDIGEAIDEISRKYDL